MDSKPKPSTEHLTLPFPESEFSGRGISFVACDDLGRTESFVVVAPDRAGAWLPLLGLLPPGATVTPPAKAIGRNGRGCVAFHSSLLGAFKSLPKEISLDTLSGNTFVYLPTDTHLPDHLQSDFIEGWYFRNPQTDFGKPKAPRFVFEPPVRIYLARIPTGTALFPEALLLPGSRLLDGADLRPVFSQRNTMLDPALRSVPTAQLFPGVPPENLSDAARKCEQDCVSKMELLCPHVLPKGWSYFPPPVIARIIEHNRLIGEGWLTSSQMAAELGASPDSDFCSALAAVTATNHVGGDADLCNIYRPVSFEELVRSPGLVKFLHALCPAGTTFIKRCITSDAARATILASEISA